MPTKLALLLAVSLTALACSSSDNSSSSTSSTSSSSGSSSTHTCADLIACCNKIVTTDGTKATCIDTYNMYKSNDTDCDLRYPAFASYCP